jgi:predicted Zn-dependent peptidase
MAIEITPEPNEDERRAILAELAAAAADPGAYASRWRASALADLRDGALAQESGSDPGVVEP